MKRTQENNFDQDIDYYNYLEKELPKQIDGKYVDDIISFFDSSVDNEKKRKIELYEKDKQRKKEIDTHNKECTDKIKEHEKVIMSLLLQIKELETGIIDIYEKWKSDPEKMHYLIMINTSVKAHYEIRIKYNEFLIKRYYSQIHNR